LKYLTRIVVLVALAVACASFGLAQAGRNPPPQPTPQPSPTPPQDQTFSVNSEEIEKFEAAMKPYIEKARKTYPEARTRYLAGLPAKHAFYVTTRLHDKQGHYEQVFIAVREIRGETIKGVIASELEFITDYRRGESYSFPEAELIDWTIVKPDGTEEGNFVGKFLDEYQKRQ
jgi:uncharacterized protein YegJ (DUF2314 family)